MYLIARVLLGLLLALVLAGAVSAADKLLSGSSEGMGFKIELVATGLGIPWGMTFVTPGRLLVTMRRGEAVLLDVESGALLRLAGLPRVAAKGQGGLLDVVIEPGYRAGGWLYLTYSKTVGGENVTVLARTRLDGKRLIDWQELLVTHSGSDTGRHFGSRIAFDGRGHVFFGVGDRGVRANGQDLGTHAGAIMRLNLDGSLPADNPFVDHAGARPEIWSYGHRNPQGLAFDAARQRLWAIEHGPRGGDELNLVTGGSNYGWPRTSHGKEYWGPFDVGEAREMPGIVSPVKVYTPSIAPGSLLLYTGTAFPRWRGNLFSGALKLQHLNRIVLDSQGRAVAEQRLLSGLGQRIRALAQDPQGWIYFSTDSGNIYRILPLKF